MATAKQKAWQKKFAAAAKKCKKSSGKSARSKCIKAALKGKGSKKKGRK